MRTGTVLKQCGCCGKFFAPKQGRYDNTKWCSPKCRTKGQRLERKKNEDY